MNKVKVSAGKQGGRVLYRFSPHAWQFVINNLPLLPLAVIGLYYGLSGAEYAKYVLPVALLLFAFLAYKYFEMTRIIYTIKDCYTKDGTKYGAQLVSEKGVFVHSVDNLELYRVSDQTVKANALQQLFKIQTLTLISSDLSDPKLPLLGVPKKLGLEDVIRELAMKSRNHRGIIESVNK